MLDEDSLRELYFGPTSRTGTTSVEIRCPRVACAKRGLPVDGRLIVR